MSNSSVSMKPVVDEAKKETEPVLVKEHELGTIEGSSEDVIVDTRLAGAPSQSMPKTDLGNFMQRPVRIFSQTLAGTDTPVSTVNSFVPWTLFLANAAVASKTKDFAYFRGTLNVQCILTVPAGAYGLYQVAACPYGDIPAAGVTVADPNVCQGAQLPHALMDLSRAEDVTLKLDWCFPFDFGSLSTTNAKTQWKIFVYCLQPVSNGQGATALTASLSVYAWADTDFEMVVPFQQGKKFLEEKRDKINDKVKKLTGGKKASEMASTVAGMAATVGSYVPFLAPMAGTIATGASMAATALDWFGFTRESGEKEPQPVVPRPFSNIANMDGIDTSEIAALSVGNSITIDPRVGGGQPVDEASFAEIFSHWTLIHSAVWDTDAAAGTLVIPTLPVTPFTSLDDIWTFAGKAVLTTAGYVGTPFQYWRGDMEYKIVIPVSKFHRGAIQVSWSPALGVVGDISNIQLNKIYEVDADNDVTLQVGFAREVPMLECRYMNATFPTIKPIGMANGSLRFTVVNSLTAPNATADTRIFIFARALPNMQFGCPKTHEITYNTLGEPRLTGFFHSWRLQGGALGDDDAEETVEQLVALSGDYPADEICIGETVASVRALMQKFTQVRSMTGMTGNLGTKGGFFITHFGMIPMASFPKCTYPYMIPSSSNEFTWMGWYQPLFVGIAGSVRYKVVNTNASVSATPLAIGAAAEPLYPGFYAVDDVQEAISPVCPIWPVRTGEAHESTVPYYHNRTFDCAYVNQDMEFGALDGAQDRIDFLMLRPVDTTTATTTVNAVVYRAAGPDLRLIRFRYTPTVTEQYGDTAGTYPVYGR